MLNPLINQFFPYESVLLVFTQIKIQTRIDDECSHMSLAILCTHNHLPNIAIFIHSTKGLSILQTHLYKFFVARNDFQKMLFTQLKIITSLFSRVLYLSELHKIPRTTKVVKSFRKAFQVDL